jgi:quercetin 2,3-dioxygenase
MLLLESWSSEHFLVPDILKTEANTQLVLYSKDSMGNTEILKRGDIQLTSAGTGITHSEKTHGPDQVHFLQIWTFPDQSHLPPKYYTRNFSDEEKTDAFVPIVAHVNNSELGVVKEREAKGPAPVHSPLTFYATLLSPEKSLTQDLRGKKGYVHLVQTSGYNPGQANGGKIKIFGGEGVEATLREGDGAYLYMGDDKKVTIENTGDRSTEVLLFDLE